MGGLAGRAAIVTGGNGGIGLALARAFAEAGADLAVWGRDPVKNDGTELAELGSRVAVVSCDVTSEVEVLRAFDQTVRELGRVDVVVANAGVARWFTPFVDVTLEQWREVMAVNLDGAFLCLREGVRHLVARGEGGSLIAVSSLAALNGAPRGGDCAASKAGLIAMMKGLAVELARHRIRSNTLVVGWADTEMNRPFIDQVGAEPVITRSPLRRFLVPEDLGAAAVFLADPALAAHTGDVVTVDGAYHLA